MYVEWKKWLLIYFSFFRTFLFFSISGSSFFRTHRLVFVRGRCNYICNIKSNKPGPAKNKKTKIESRKIHRKMGKCENERVNANIKPQKNELNLLTIFCSKNGTMNGTETVDIQPVSLSLSLSVALTGCTRGVVRLGQIWTKKATGRPISNKVRSSLLFGFTLASRVSTHTYYFVLPSWV